MLLYLFVVRNYESVDIVFIRYHTNAQEVTEEEFFNSRETGGTVTSNAYRLANEIAEARYPSDTWNIYVAHASDGDNFFSDNQETKEVIHQMLPKLRALIYIEIGTSSHGMLERIFKPLKSETDKVIFATIDPYDDVYQVFRKLFKKREGAK